jgi:hypothetical protein
MAKPSHNHPPIESYIMDGNALTLGFNLFELFARLHGKLSRAGRVTSRLARQPGRVLEAVPELALVWSG